MASTLKLYEYEVAGVVHTAQMSAEDAERLGAKEAGARQAKARQAPANKAAG